MLTNSKEVTSWGPSVIAYFNLSTKEAEVGRSLWIWDQYGLHRRFWANQGYTVRPCQKQNKYTNKKNLWHGLSFHVTWIYFSLITSQQIPKIKIFECNMQRSSMDTPPCQWTLYHTQWKEDTGHGDIFGHHKMYFIFLLFIPQEVNFFL